MKLPQMKGKGLENVVKDADPEALDLIARMLRWNPKDRPDMKTVLKHDYF
jgi:serine/threonine protein kinase